MEKQVLELIAKCSYHDGKPMPRKRRDKFSRYDTQIVKCGEDTKALQKFVDVNRSAFQKITKKYRVSTKSLLEGL